MYTEATRCSACIKVLYQTWEPNEYVRKGKRGVLALRENEKVLIFATSFIVVGVANLLTGSLLLWPETP